MERIIIAVGVIQCRLDIYSRMTTEHGKPGFKIIFHVSIQFRIIIIISEPKCNFHRIRQFRIILLGKNIIIQDPVDRFLLTCGYIIRIFSQISGSLLKRYRKHFTSGSRCHAKGRCYPLFYAQITGKNTDSHNKCIFPRALYQEEKQKDQRRQDQMNAIISGKTNTDSQKK